MPGPTHLLRAVLRPLRKALWYRRQRRLIDSGWYDPAARSDARAVFIGGCPRSGTTLVRELLARHPAFANTVESALLVPGYDAGRVAMRWSLERREVERMAREAGSLVELAERFYAEIAGAQGKPRWIDKAPANVRIIGQLLAWFPQGRFIHVLRDGRDVVCSLRHHPRQVLRNGKVYESTVDNSAEECAETWVTEAGYGLAHNGHPRCLELRYESLVSQPQPTLELLCAFVDEPFDQRMLEAGPGVDLPLTRLINNPEAIAPISCGRVGRWKRELSPAERVAVHHIAGGLLRATGYSSDDRWVTDTPEEDRTTETKPQVTPANDTSK